MKKQSVIPMLLAALAVMGTGLSLILAKDAAPAAILAQAGITLGAWALLAVGWRRDKKGKPCELLFRFSMVFSVVACLPLIGTAATVLVAWVKTL